MGVLLSVVEIEIVKYICILILVFFICLVSMIKEIFLVFFLIIVFLLIGFVLYYRFYFLRNPSRKIPHDDKLFVSPANWRIIAIIRQKDLKNKKLELYKENDVVIDDWTDWFKWATLVSIMMTPFDVHFQKAPTTATLIGQNYEEWYFYNAMKTKKWMRSTFQNEYNNMLFWTDEWYRFRVIQIAWFFARRIVSYLHLQDEVRQGDPIGHIKFWSQVSVILDDNFEVKVKVWDKVIDWETVIAVKK